MGPTVGRPRIKVCCIAGTEEAWTVIRHGVSAVGLVSSMPSGPGVISDEVIRTIASTIPPGVSSFLLTCAQRAEVIIEQHRNAGTDTLQLVDAVSPDVYQHLKHSLPGIRLVQVVHVQDDTAIQEAVTAAEEVHAILLDSGNPTSAVKVLGGTGRTHNWEISRTIRERINVPLYLAGGLSPSNVAEAVRVVRPFGIDVCSAVRSDGALDPEKLAAFVTAASGTDDSLT